MEILKIMLYMGGNLLYLIGWILALIGLGLVQDQCKDVHTNDSSVGLGSVPFFTEPIGDDCKKGFRFLWFIWSLNTIPPLLAVAATFMPDRARGASTSFFAVIAPLNILVANSMYDARTITDNDDIEDHLEIAFTGFCILSGFALLMLLMDSLLVSAPAKSSVQHADAAKPAAAETDAAEAV